MNSFIDRIELYPDVSRKKDNPIKRVVFKFPVSYCGEPVFEVLSPKETTDETVVILRGVKTDSHISVDLDVEKIGLNHKL